MTDQASAEESPTKPVVFLPGHAFFVDIFETPEALETSEIENLVELSLESLSPFPIEQLCWGFIHSEEAQKILLYATHRERLEQLGYKDLKNYLWVFPDFIAPLKSSQMPSGEDILLDGGLSQTFIRTLDGSQFPNQILSRQSIDEIANAQTLTCLQIAEASANDKGLPVLKLVGPKVEALEHPEPLDLQNAELWHADIRPPSFKKIEKNRRRMASIIGRLTAYAAILGILILFLEGLLFVGGIWSGKQNRVVESQLATVRRIGDKQSLINKLDQVAQSELRPIAILDALNQTLPKGIYFTEAVTEGRNRVTVEGIANTISELNTYIQSLRDSGKFELIGNPKQQTSRGITQFSVTLDYFHSNSEEEEQG